ncbi:MAG: RNA repair domain-containing protein [Candidatus Helarchaeota archaeon]
MPESLIRKILNQIKWDKSKNSMEYEITFLHRGAVGNRKTYSATQIKDIKSSYLIFNETEGDEVIIPFHRIRRIFNKRTNQIIWEK